MNVLIKHFFIIQYFILLMWTAKTCSIFIYIRCPIILRIYSWFISIIAEIRTTITFRTWSCTTRIRSPVCIKRCISCWLTWRTNLCSSSCSSKPSIKWIISTTNTWECTIWISYCNSSCLCCWSSSISIKCNSIFIWITFCSI